MTLDTFLTKWRSSGGAERANYSLFLIELCDLLELPHPEATRPREQDNAYVFEKGVTETYRDGSSSERRIDLYKRGCFVLEAKQGVEARGDEGTLEHSKKRKRGHGTRGSVAFDTALAKAKEQGERYIHLLPAEEGRPPFLLIVDVGASIEIYAEFTRTGGVYVPFPSPQECRIPLETLLEPDIKSRLRAVWLEPLGLDPTRRAARVTREVSDKLAHLSASLEGSYSLERVSPFLMRLIFTLFAEDILLLPQGKVTGLLRELTENPETFPEAFGELWTTMRNGGYSAILRSKVLHFNGGLFENAEVLSLSRAELMAVLSLAELDWSEVEPSIFGTLLERALDPGERHKLGAHYTPRAYVERLIHRVILLPLRGEWQEVQVETLRLLEAGKDAQAREAVVGFLAQLCSLRILDPSCGSANFLYVALERIKRLEAEAVETLVRLGGQPPLQEVDPHQFLGLEINSRAAGIAELVLWIGFLQFYARVHGRVAPPEPVLRAFRNIETRDAVLAFDALEPILDSEGRPQLRWDGKTTFLEPISGREMPDLSATVGDTRPLNPRASVWPDCDFIVSNPPFLGAGPMRSSLGDGYVEALRGVYGPLGVPDSSDFVMTWVYKALDLLEGGHLRGFGLVTTNSVRQTFNRKVVQPFLARGGLHFSYAIPDHPWVDAGDGADVRIALSAFKGGSGEGLLERVVFEKPSGHGEYEVVTVDKVGIIHADFTVGANLTTATSLEANSALSSPGVKLHGAGFIVSAELVGQWAKSSPDLERVVREYRNGRDLTARPRGVKVIDFYGLSATEALERYPQAYQHVLVQVKPERIGKAGLSKDSQEYAARWWLFGKTRSELRRALEGLPRYIVTVETSKHRIFTFLDASILPDNKLVVFALEDAYFIGVLSSRVHVLWALGQGSHLGVGNDPVYVKSRCFETFPFPAPTERLSEVIRELAERLDAHRKSALERDPSLTLTGLYNVLEKLKAGEVLGALERSAHDSGLVSVLLELHRELDSKVLEAYGWLDTPDDEAVLERLLALNLERDREEREGLVRYLRPDYQARGRTIQGGLALSVPTSVVKTPSKGRFPTPLREQVRAVKAVLEEAAGPLDAQQVAAAFSGVKGSVVLELLETLSELGQVREVELGRYAL